VSVLYIYTYDHDIGLPWKHIKTRPFNPVFTYMGFEWLLPNRSVSIPNAKKAKYLDWLAAWVPGARLGVRNAEQLLRTLVHCTLAVPDGRAHIVAIIKFAASFGSAHSRFARWEPSGRVLQDVVFWQTQLKKPFCGSILRAPPPALPTEFLVDALTGWGVGVVFDGTWEL
jgi:hypothetical protein